MNMRNSHIIGTGYYVPDNIVSNHSLSQQIDTNNEWSRVRQMFVDKLAIPEHTYDFRARQFVHYLRKYYGETYDR